VAKGSVLEVVVPATKNLQKGNELRVFKVANIELLLGTDFEDEGNQTAQVSRPNQVSLEIE
jgi:hypothetical protein